MHNKYFISHSFLTLILLLLSTKFPQCVNSTFIRQISEKIFHLWMNVTGYGRCRKVVLFTIQPHLEVGEELLRFAVVLSLHDDVRQLVDDDIEGPLWHQRQSKVNLRERKLCNVTNPSSYSDAFLLQSYVNVHQLLVEDINWANSVAIINYRAKWLTQLWHSGNYCTAFIFTPAPQIYTTALLF